MDLEVLVSKKGTKVVTATNLYQVLQLPKSQYLPTVRRWFKEVYEFKDGIRLPLHLQDYAKRHTENGVVDDYYISVELAKLITLNSTSKVKRKYANRLLSLEDKVENAELLTKEQVVAVLELAKVMGLISCQQASEKEHYRRFEKETGAPSTWWGHRADVLGYSTSKIKASLQEKGKQPKGKSQRELLFQIDKYETIRAGVIDLFLALGKTETYARNLGDLAKVFAKELGIEIWDDSKAPVAFTSNLNQELIHEIHNMHKGELLSLW
ncbi:MAG TPA: hypothetical protein PKC40_01835 [Saprospiraceae bacterium]|nr:hypothetical protein [Saprospiraceae bacterium]